MGASFAGGRALKPYVPMVLEGNEFYFVIGIHVAITKQQDNNSYLLSPEKGWSCPPKIGLFLFIGFENAHFFNGGGFCPLPGI